MRSDENILVRGEAVNFFFFCVSCPLSPDGESLGGPVKFLDPFSSKICFLDVYFHLKKIHQSWLGSQSFASYSQRPKCHGSPNYAKFKNEGKRMVSLKVKDLLHTLREISKLA